MISKKVKEVLKKEGFLTKEQNEKLKEFEKLHMGNVLDFCAEHGIAPTQRLMALLRESHMLPVIDLANTQIDPALNAAIPKAVCFEHTLIPFYETDAVLYVALADPDSNELVRFLQESTKKQVVPYLAHRSAIKTALDLLFNQSVEASEQHIHDLIATAQGLTQTAEVMAKEAPIIALLNHFLLFGVRRTASDLHIEPRDGDVVVRYRIDGLLHDLFTLPKALLAPMIARVKIVSRMRIDEHQRPQDGRFTFTEGNAHLAVRVSVIPTLHGEKASLRLLDTQNEHLSLDVLGMDADQRAGVDEMLKLSSGLILVSGPTGSGKTSTLYAMLKALAGRNVNISTIEDPIEYHLRGANQMQVNHAVDLTFAQGLRSILRQDPDIILVGEIRDRETAEIAINAALTGHLVLSSIHTKSAAAAIPRLLDMGVEPFLVASTLRAVIGQRLVRTVCPSCGTPMTATGLVKDGLPDGTTLVHGTGCERCHGTGYQGRMGIFELLMLDDRFHDPIMQRAHAAALSELAQQQGMRSLKEDGIAKVQRLATTIEEVQRTLQ